jgi:hypothetical protein
MPSNGGLPLVLVGGGEGQGGSLYSPNQPGVGWWSGSIGISLFGQRRIFICYPPYFQALEDKNGRVLGWHGVYFDQNDIEVMERSNGLIHG